MLRDDKINYRGSGGSACCGPPYGHSKRSSGYEMQSSGARCNHCNFSAVASWHFRAAACRDGSFVAASNAIKSRCPVVTRDFDVSRRPKRWGSHEGSPSKWLLRVASRSESSLEPALQVVTRTYRHHLTSCFRHNKAAEERERMRDSRKECVTDITHTHT